MRTGVARADSWRQAWSNWQGAIRRLRCAKSTLLIGKCQWRGNTTSTHSRRLTSTIAGAVWLAPLMALTSTESRVTLRKQKPAADAERPRVALGFLQAAGPQLLRPGYCLSYTATFLNGLPSRSVPLVTTVRLLPSAETTIRPLPTTLPWFIVLNSE